MSDSNYIRIAIVSTDKCKPKRCGLECKKSCPVVRTGKLCIQVSSDDKIANISETLCIGCNICTKKCPFGAIKIINLPKNLDEQTTHRFGKNQFKLHRLPTPRPGQILGLVGSNGIGKSTALKVLAGKLKPNLGRFENPPDWKEILTYFRGNELQNYFTRILQDNLQSVIKPQYIDTIPRAIQGKVGELVSSRDKLGIKQKIYDELEMNNILDRKLDELSGGELQRFAIAIVAVQDQDIYMFDEPSSFLDVKQRLNASKVIRQILKYATVDKAKYIIVIEHDLAILDYLSDFVCILYGTPGIYGVVTLPFNVREGINIFLEGNIRTEKLRFRDFELSFKIGEKFERDEERNRIYHYEYMTKTVGDFKLTVKPGDFTDSEIIVLLGKNGMGKTTLIRLFAGLKADDEKNSIPEMNVSYKPQSISPKFSGTVQQLLQKKIPNSYMHPQFHTDVMKPLKIELLFDKEVRTLSGGELQRVAVALCLGKPADLYLLDEPSAYLDSEQRIITSKVIKRFILHSKKTAFVVEHDFIMATYVADRVIVYDGEPSICATANAPQPLLQGMNAFLLGLDVTLRRDPDNFRPRINKFDSILDREQKLSGNYFFIS